MKAGFYQFAPVFGKKDENIKKVLSVLSDTEADFIVLPEFFATGYQFISKNEVAELSEPVPEGYTTQLLSELSRQKGIYIFFDWFFPESMRVLALMGAEIIAHPANLVLPYCPAAMPVRCLENRVYAITANRIGEENKKEGQSLRFIGQSLIASPEGEVFVKASENEEVLMVADIKPESARDKSLTALNNVFNDRRPEMYSKITEEIPGSIHNSR